VRSNLTELAVLRFLLLFLGGFVVLACFSFFFVVAREQCFVRVLVADATA
jgi:hypothetical protein